MNKLYFRFWFWWLVLTLVYLLGSVTSIGGKLIFLIGMFVPFGIFNTMASTQSVLGIVMMVILVVSLFRADKMAEKIGMSLGWKKVVFNLGLLLILTLLTDLAIWRDWNSYKLLMGLDIIK